MSVLRWSEEQLAAHQKRMAASSGVAVRKVIRTRENAAKGSKGRPAVVHGSPLEEALAQQIVAAKLPPAKREYRFAPPRQFRLDFAWPDRKVACEVNGGIWVKSGHSSGKGIERDYEKANLAVLNGWRLLQFSAGAIKSGSALQCLRELLK